MNPVDKLKQLMSKLVELPPTPDKLDLAIDFCSDGEFPTAQSVSDAIIADMQSAPSPTKFLWDSCNIDLENEDVGSIVGFDASGGPVLDKYDIVPEGDVSELVVPPSTEVINGLKVTYPSYNSLNPSGQFIMKCMSKWWLKGAFDLVELGYGLKFTDTSFTRSMPITLDDVAPSGGAIIMAYVTSTFDVSTGNTVTISCAVNTNPAAYGDMDLTNPNGKANSFAGSNMFLDRVLCHELVHGVMSANIPGFSTRLPKWFKEGTAELIAGADDTRKDGLLATASSVDMFQAGLDNNAVDTLRWYTTGYIWLRWFIKHTSILLPNLSFDHSLPDIEIFEYKVSDGVAFEWGRVNNCKFNLVSDELLDFVLRSHFGLSKWDLCTSKEYLHSGYGATVRVPFDDSEESIEFDYIDIANIKDSNMCIMTSRKGPRKDNGIFVYTCPDIVSTFAFGPPIPHGSSEYYLEAYGLYSSLKNGSDIHGFIYDVSIYMHEWNTSLGISDYNDVDDVTPFSKDYPFNTRHYILIGAEHLYDYFNSFDSSNIADVLNAIDSNYEDAVEHDFYVKFYDFSFLRLRDIVDNIINNEAYVQSLTSALSADNLTIVQYIESKGYGDRIQYYDCRKYILESFPSVADFRTKAICTELPDNIFWGKYPISSSDFCLTEYFADVIWEHLELDPVYVPNNAEWEEITYVPLPDGANPLVAYAELGYGSGLTGIFSLCTMILPEIRGYEDVETIIDHHKYGGPKFFISPSYSSYFSIPVHTTIYNCVFAGEEVLSESKAQIRSYVKSEFAYFMDGWGTHRHGHFIIIGLESLCIFGFSVSEIILLIDELKDKALSGENNILHVAFVPLKLYSSMIYDTYVALKQRCIEKNIPIALDNYVCMHSNSIVDYYKFCSLTYRPLADFTTGSSRSFGGTEYSAMINILKSKYGGDWVAYSDNSALAYFYFCSDDNDGFIITREHVHNTKLPCYYVSFTDLPFSDMIVPDKEIAIQAVDGVAGDVLSVNLHTIYDPLSPAYYQGGGVCKPVYDFVVDPETNKTITGLINHHNDGANVPNVDANYSYPVYGTGCPWIIYPDDIKELYDIVYFYFTRDNYTGTITYQLSSSHDDSVKSIYQTIVYGSTDIDNYTSKYPLYVGGGVVPFSPTQYSFIYQPPKPPGAEKAPPAVTVTVMGNKYNFDLTTTLSSNTLPLYPIHPQDSKLSNFALKCADGEWKFISSFDSHNVESTIEDSPCLYTLSDTMRWGVMLPYVGSDFYNMYVYDKYFDNIRQLKPLRVLNPNMNLKEELGFGAITLPTLWASHTDNVHGLRTLTTTNYESKSILDIDFMQSVADGDVINIHGNYDAYGGDVTFNSSLGPYGVGPSSFVFTDPFDEFDRIDVIFTEDTGTNKYVASWNKAELSEAIFGDRDIDFDITRGSVHPLYWKINKSGCNKTVFYGLGQNCGIIDIVGYRKKSFRYLVVPNGYSKREFNMFAYSNDKDNTLNYKQQFERYNEIINSYRLNNDLYIYVGS